MKTLLKIFGYCIGTLVLIIGATSIAARFSDGPLEIFAGGPFTSGQPAPIEPNWSFIKEYNTVEFQLLEPEASRTTWIVEHDGRLFIPSGYMTTWWGKLWKQWPMQALDDPRAILRVDGIVYDRELVRITDGPEVPFVLSELGRKYGNGLPLPENALSSGYLWIFELVPRK